MEDVRSRRDKETPPQPSESLCTVGGYRSPRRVQLHLRENDHSGSSLSDEEREPLSRKKLEECPRPKQKKLTASINQRYYPVHTSELQYYRRAQEQSE